MNALTALTVSLVLTATMCASYVRNKVPAPEFVKTESGIAKEVEAPPAPPLTRAETGE